MKLPKQAAPVQRTQPSMAGNRQEQGVEASFIFPLLLAAPMIKKLVTGQI